jgi:hypothetical protein
MTYGIMQVLHSLPTLRMLWRQYLSGCSVYMLIYIILTFRKLWASKKRPI